MSSAVTVKRVRSSVVLGGGRRRGWWRVVAVLVAVVPGVVVGTVSVSVAAGGSVSGGVYTVVLPDSLRQAWMKPAADPAGNIYFATNTALGGVYNAVWMRDMSGVVTKIAGDVDLGYVDGPGDQARFYYPSEVVFFDHFLFVADEGNRVIRRIDLSSSDHTVTTLAGVNYFLYSMTIDPGSGDIYIVGHHAKDILKVTQAGDLTMLGVPAGWIEDNPYGIQYANGSVFVADGRDIDGSWVGHSRLVKYDLLTSTPSAVTASATSACTNDTYQSGVPEGDGGPAASTVVCRLNGVAIASDGTIYVWDSSYGVLRRIGVDGIITTVTGQGTLDYPGALGCAGGTGCMAEGGQASSLSRSAFGSYGITFINGDLYIPANGIWRIASPGSGSGTGDVALTVTIPRVRMTSSLVGLPPGNPTVSVWVDWPGNPGGPVRTDAGFRPSPVESPAGWLTIPVSVTATVPRANNVTVHIEADWTGDGLPIDLNPTTGKEAVDLIVGTGSLVDGVPVWSGDAPYGESTTTGGGPNAAVGQMSFSLTTRSPLPNLPGKTRAPETNPIPGDSDGDGVLDAWEVFGYEPNPGRAPRLKFNEWGANVAVPDLWVEVDTSADAARAGDGDLKRIWEAFANQDGRVGYNIHFDNGPGSIADFATGKRWGQNDSQAGVIHRADGSQLSGPVDIFDLHTEIGAPPYQPNLAPVPPNSSYVNFSPSRHPFFRYAAFVNSHKDPIVSAVKLPPNPTVAERVIHSMYRFGYKSGMALGDGYVASVGMEFGRTLGIEADGVGRAATLMHELGHTFGLVGGAPDGGDVSPVNPFYTSTMSYAYTSGLPLGTSNSPAGFNFRGMDFSRKPVPTHSEELVNESNFTTYDFFASQHVGYATKLCDGDTWNPLVRPWTYRPFDQDSGGITGPFLDWNCDGKPTAVGPININNTFRIPPPLGANTIAGQELDTFDPRYADWDCVQPRVAVKTCSNLAVLPPDPTPSPEEMEVRPDQSWRMGLSESTAAVAVPAGGSVTVPVVARNTGEQPLDVSIVVGGAVTAVTPGSFRLESGAVQVAIATITAPAGTNPGDAVTGWLDSRGYASTTTAIRATIITGPAPTPPPATSVSTGFGTPVTVPVPSGALRVVDTGWSRSVTAGVGTLTYTPSDGFVGTDVIVYEQCTGTGVCVAATVTVNVAGPAVCTITGTTGPDQLTGTPDADVICGLGGNDTIDAGAGNDIIVGGPGADKVSGGDGDDRAYGGPGDDVIRGQAGNDTLAGGAGFDRLEAGDGNDTLTEDSGWNWLDAGPGNDTITGGPNPDTILAGPGDDTINTGPGDSVQAGAGTDIVNGAVVDTVVLDGPAAHLVGVVTLPDGTPASGIGVDRYGPDGGLLDSATTDTSGGYQITGTPALSTLRFTDPQNRVPTQWYQAAGTAATAAPLDVPEGQVTNLPVTLIGTSTITGTVTRTDSAPLPGIIVTASVGTDTLATTTTGPDGRYTLGPVPAVANVTVRFDDPTNAYQTQWWNNATTAAEATPINLTTASVVTDAVLTSRSYEDVVKADRPEGYWRLDETQGKVASDSVGTHHGRYQGKPTLGLPGAVTTGTAVAFNRSGDKLRIPDFPALALTPASTLEFWAKPPDTPSRNGNGNGHGHTRTLFQRDHDWTITQTSDGRTTFTQGNQRLTTPRNPDPNAWHHYALVDDGTTLTWWVDATPVASVTTARRSTRTHHGHLTVAPNAEIILDEIAVYNRALTTEQIRTHQQLRR